MNFLKSFINSSEEATESNSQADKQINISDATVLDATNSKPEEPGYFDWFYGMYSQSSEVWEQMKHDFSEVAHAVTSDPLSAVERTASSVVHQLSNLTSSLRDDVAHTGDRHGPEGDESTSSVNSFISGLVSAVEKRISSLTLNTPSWEARTSSASRREACIEIIRSDPRTFTAVLPASDGWLSYADWRSAYFDEDSCQPRPGMPLQESPARAPLDISPRHPDPATVLTESPVVRAHLLRLVEPDVMEGGAGSPPKRATISEADFWSRYYYRVWLLDVTEARRHRLAQRLEEAPHGDTLDTGSACLWPTLLENAPTLDEAHTLTTMDSGDEYTVPPENLENVFNIDRDPLQSMEEQMKLQPALENEASPSLKTSSASSFVFVVRPDDETTEKQSHLLSDFSNCGDWEDECDVEPTVDDDAGVKLEGLSKTKALPGENEEIKVHTWEDWS